MNSTRDIQCDCYGGTHESYCCICGDLTHCCRRHVAVIVVDPDGAA